MQTLTVGELREMLAAYEADMPVRIAVNSGDYWHTVLAKDVESVDTGYTEYSDYHRCNKVSEDEDADTEHVVLINLI